MSSMPYAVPSSADETLGGGGGGGGVGGLPHHHASAHTAVRNTSNNDNSMNVAAFDPSDVDKLLAEHLKELSVRDREGIAEEVSCCPTRIQKVCSTSAPGQNRHFGQ